MAGVRDGFDNRRNLYGVLSSGDYVANSNPGNAWGGQSYDAVYEQQHWYGYNPSRQQGWGKGTQDGAAVPPVSALSSPQAPLPASLVAIPSTGGSDQGCANTGAESYSEYDKYAQQEGQVSAGYRLVEVQAINYEIPRAHPMATNVSQSYATGYAGYNYMPDQNAYGSMNYQGYNNNAYQKQGSESYSQHTGIYSFGVAPPATTADLQHLGTHIDAALFDSTGNYYDPDGDESAGYQHAYYGVDVESQVLSNACYTASSVNSDVAYSVVNFEPEHSMQYAQDYVQQWADYHRTIQGAPQADTESNDVKSGSLAAEPTYASVLAAPTEQPPPPGTAVPQLSWQVATLSYGVSQGSQVSSTTESVSGGTTCNGSSNRTSQSDHFNLRIFTPLAKHSRAPATQHQQQPLKFQKIQAGLKIQQGDRRAAKLHIVTNPRIVGNVSGVGASEEAAKPVYASVVAKKSACSSVSIDAVADATLQPGMFPSSLRAYVERALSRCKDESQKAACQVVLKDMITNASLDGTLFTRDWDREPLFAVPPSLSLSLKKEVLQQQSTSCKSEWSLARRLKTRWEPPAELEPDNRTGRALGFCRIERGSLDSSKDNDSLRFQSKWDKEICSKTNIPTNTMAGIDLKNMSKKGSKRLRKVDLRLKSAEDTSGETKAERGHVVLLGSMSTADPPEEKERRQNRFKRFDRGKNSGRDRGWGSASESANARRATVLQLALNSGEVQNGRAVEDIDWDSLTIRGTCQEVEKRYLRLTSAPDPHIVRPKDVLRRALEMVKCTTKSYLFKCEQLKSIRQDLTVQRIRDEFTVEVYETHARMALEATDLPEYNQCQTQLKSLYGEGIKGCSNEFAAYSFLYILFNCGNSRDLLSAMSRLTQDGRRNDVVKHALAVRNAVAVGNYTTFFRLYRSAPVLSPYLMDIHMEKMRFDGFKCMTRSYRPTIPVVSVAHSLGFSTEPSLEVGTEGVDECEEWLRAHGAHVQFDNSSSELVVQAKLSTRSLFMPEPEDVVPHGDVNLALNDFFSRS
ncbi:hypothetical protein KC19_VG254300 [Ceratodon purpureus]|uniref:PCI domain-containing protein n=1 Tax=Ceratodon purpureus TaxID=3225 RepID=A0A8T0HTH8_CERPU|nr:hypothetical protein KC19_VG254300 [Ceratodon purpureus]